MRVLITGSRNWDDQDTIIGAMLHVLKDADAKDIMIVTGACPTGADKIAEDVAKYVGWPVEKNPADWEKWGKAAGPVRNTAMVDAGADICLAFIKDNSRGATQTADLAEESGILTVRHHL